MDAHILPNSESERRAAVIASHRRCITLTTASVDAASLKKLPEELLARVLKKEHTLLNYAVATVENTFELVEGSGSAVAVVDIDGTVLFSRTDAHLTDPAGQPIFQPGSCWSEAKIGTNAIGVCLLDQAGICVRSDEHHVTWLQSYCTCAAPILDRRGTTAGALAVITKGGSTQLHTLGFIRTTAILVENRMLIGEMADQAILFFHPEPNNIGTIKQCIAVFDKQGALVGTNSAARRYLKLDQPHSASRRFEELFNSSFEVLTRHGSADPIRPFHLSLCDGRDVCAVLNRSISNIHGPGFHTGSSTASRSSARGARSVLPKDLADLTLHDLDTGDPQMHRAVKKAQRVIGLDLPLMIEGETGVGKEMFTRAFHNSGPRKQGPFVAVNCAAIPEGLIESELFGYEEGAFTGAKRRGNVGKILQANGGTLFLDEIGDMPHQLQGRLLRVLQERQVNPLGSNKAVSVDFSLICATHRNLRQEIVEGRFREDLYYRLNGLRLLLPPLRERKDLIQLALLIAQREGGGRNIELSAEVIDAFQRADWPGNIRQMQMLIRTALALAYPGSTVSMEHLPDEFLNDLTRPGVEAALSDATKEHGALMPRGGGLAEMELVAIRRALAATKGNVSEAARLLGISRKTIYRKLEKASTAFEGD